MLQFGELKTNFISIWTKNYNNGFTLGIGNKFFLEGGAREF